MGSAKYTELIFTIRLDLLELFGSHYVIDHCIVALNQSRKKDAFRSFIADGIKNINEIVAKHYGGSYISIRYDEMIGTDKRTNEPESGDEIVREVFRKAGLKAKGGEGDSDDI